MVRKNNEGVEIEYRTIKIICEKDKYEFIRQALDKLKVDLGQPDMTDGRAIELLLAEVLS